MTGERRRQEDLLSQEGNDASRRDAHFINPAALSALVMTAPMSRCDDADLLRPSLAFCVDAASPCHSGSSISGSCTSGSCTLGSCTSGFCASGAETTIG